MSHYTTEEVWNLGCHQTKKIRTQSLYVIDYRGGLNITSLGQIRWGRR